MDAKAMPFLGLPLSSFKTACIMSRHLYKAMKEEVFNVCRQYGNPNVITSKDTAGVG